MQRLQSETDKQKHTPFGVRNNKSRGLKDSGRTKCAVRDLSLCLYGQTITNCYGCQWIKEACVATNEEPSRCVVLHTTLSSKDGNQF